jgi:hypothetical protein
MLFETIRIMDPCIEMSRVFSAEEYIQYTVVHEAFHVKMICYTDIKLYMLPEVYNQILLNWIELPHFTETCQLDSHSCICV